MTTLTSHSTAFGSYAETIQALHLNDRKNRAVRTWRAVAVGGLLVLLGSAALMG
jgi:hypothetical protein